MCVAKLLQFGGHFMGDKSIKGGHVMKKKLTKKELKAQNHAKLMEQKKSKSGGEMQNQISGVNHSSVDKKAA